MVFIVLQRDDLFVLVSSSKRPSAGRRTKTSEESERILELFGLPAVAPKETDEANLPSDDYKTTRRLSRMLQ